MTLIICILKKCAQLLLNSTCKKWFYYVQIVNVLEVVKVPLNNELDSTALHVYYLYLYLYLKAESISEVLFKQIPFGSVLGVPGPCHMHVCFCLPLLLFARSRLRPFLQSIVIHLVYTSCPSPLHFLEFFDDIFHPGFAGYYLIILHLTFLL